MNKKSLAVVLILLELIITATFAVLAVQNNSVVFGVVSLWSLAMASWIAYDAFHGEIKAG